MMEANETQEITENEGYSESSAKRKLVIPGEIIVTGDDYLPGEGARREGENILAGKYGLAEEMGRVVKVIPISGAFVPRRSNVVIGRVTGIISKGWLIDIDSASGAFLPIEESPRFIRREEMDQFLAVGDVLAAKIWSTNGKGIDLSLRSKGLGKLEGGFTFRVIPARVPRIIGKEGSMITMVKDKTGCNITVGQNGWIWIKGNDIDSEIRARNAIKYIADSVNVSGLTDKMEDWFANN